MAQASRDQNNVPTLLGVSNVDGRTPITVYADPVTHRLLVDSSGSSFVTSAARAYKSAGQTVAGGFGTTEKILFQTESFDVNAEFSSSTFTAKNAGYYQVSASLFKQGGGSIGFAAMIYRNGTIYSSSFSMNSGESQSIVISDIVRLSVGETVEIYAENTDVAPLVFQAADLSASPPAISFVSIAKVA